jgi:hypothetical protein
MIDELDNVDALDPVRDIPVNPPGLKPLDKLFKVTEVCFYGLDRVIFTLKRLLK